MVRQQKLIPLTKKKPRMYCLTMLLASNVTVIAALNDVPQLRNDLTVVGRAMPYPQNIKCYSYYYSEQPNGTIW